MLTTTCAFGLDDQEFVMASETNIPGGILDLVIELRGTEARRFTARDTRTCTSLGWSLNEPLDGLG